MLGAKRKVEARDGRALAVYEGGDPSGAPVVMHHGTPSSGLLYSRHDALAREQGVRLIGYDRPGYGGSARSPGRAVADCVDDVEAIADGLDLERFACWGTSGGGPHALACAARGSDRLAAVASLAAVAPYEAERLDWTAGMGESNLEEFAAILEGEAALRPLLEREAGEMRGAQPEELVELWSTLLGPEDQSVLTGEFAAYVLDSSRQGLRDGVDGWLDDDFAFVKPWGFELAQISRPVLLLHGDDDRFVPVSHAYWLAERIPGVEARIDANDGHLTLLERRLREAHEWLLARF